MSGLLCCLSLVAFADAPIDSQRVAELIIHRYIGLPFPEDGQDPLGDVRSARLDVLSELQEVPEGAVAAVRDLGPGLSDTRKHVELVECISGIHTAESAALLAELLDDDDVLIRRTAIQGLHRMTRRTDHFGPQRQVRQRNLHPAVTGLFPELVKAAQDKDKWVRMTAIHAIADSRNPAAVSALRERLKDAAPEVQFRAACLLAEFGDDAGLEVIGRRLQQLKADGNRDAVGYYPDAAMLAAALMRLSGQDFGKIPMNPHLCSDTREIPRLKLQYDDLIQACSKWWAQHQPDRSASVDAGKPVRAVVE